MEKLSKRTDIYIYYDLAADFCRIYFAFIRSQFKRNIISAIKKVFVAAGDAGEKRTRDGYSETINSGRNGSLIDSLDGYRYMSTTRRLKLNFLNKPSPPPHPPPAKKVEKVKKIWGSLSISNSAIT